MSRRDTFLGPVLSWWAQSRPRMRLLVGSTVLAVIGLTGLTPNVMFDIALSWPYAALIAAAGWGRSGLGFGPMIALVLFGIAQDITSDAALGVHALVNLLTYGFSVLVSQTFDVQRSQSIAYGLPILSIGLGVSLVWLLASVSSGHAERVLPMFAVFLSTVFIHMIAAPVFDLGIRRGDSAGASI